MWTWGRQAGIYVEVRIDTPVERVWALTQAPAVHRRWDLRFTEIEYLPKATEAEPQQFLYATRIGFGLAIRGTGESVATRRNGAGEAVSSLKFASEDWKSLISEGAGYWRYVPLAEAEVSTGKDRLGRTNGPGQVMGETARGAPEVATGLAAAGPASGPGGIETATRFFTWYDYRVRLGWVGRVVDRLVVRPVMGWATAWSFDRLRLWAERGIPPEQSLAFAAIHAVSCVGIAFVWIWHGLVPKLIFRNADELRMLAESGVAAGWLTWFGAAEVVLGVATLLLWRWRGMFVVQAGFMMAALAGVAVTSPEYVTHAFNPVTLNLLVLGLAVAGWLAFPGVPFAGRCLRVDPRRSAGANA